MLIKYFNIPPPNIICTCMNIMWPLTRCGSTDNFFEKYFFFCIVNKFYTGTEYVYTRLKIILHYRQYLP